METRICNKCGIEKPISAFYPKMETNNRSQVRCVECCNEDKLKRHHETKSDGKHATRMHEYYLNNKEKWETPEAKEAAKTRKQKPEYKEYQRQYREENREEINGKLKEYRSVIKKQVYVAYGNKCACCGETEEKFLGIDHVNNDGAAHRKKVKNPTKRMKMIIEDNFPSDFQLLCHNCNLGRYLNNGICPHK